MKTIIDTKELKVIEMENKHTISFSFQPMVSEIEKMFISDKSIEVKLKNGKTERLGLSDSDRLKINFKSETIIERQGEILIRFYKNT